MVHGWQNTLLKNNEVRSAMHCYRRNYRALIITLTATASLIVPPSTPLTFYSTYHFHSRTRRNWLTLDLFNTNKQRSDALYPSLSSYANSTTASRRSKIFKILKRNVYPTIDIPFHENNYTAIDHYFMGLALRQAQYAWDRGEVPIGAIIVRECNPPVDDDAAEYNYTSRRVFQILSTGHNRVETNVDASAHAELMALRQGASNIQNWRFPLNSRLYTTLEPCPMCLASIQAFRIDHIIYGAPDNRLGAIKTHMELLNVAKHPYHEVKSVTGGVREDECGDIMVQFFRERRRKNHEIVGYGQKLLRLPRKDEDGGRWTRFIPALFRRQ
jgi:tRNA(adenine34) deaminase